jgi:hypothetical protein
MNAQIRINFEVVPTSSPINIDKLRGQNRRLLEYLLAGNSIHCMSAEKAQMGIGYLNSRIADLREFLRFSEYKIVSKPHTVGDVHVKLYTIEKINN